jgi:RHS repeat-associated protein
MLVPNRNFSSPSYRYGFQGQEKDDEIKGNGNSINYKFRMHDPRVGRFFAVDPLTAKYPHYTPYSFSGNKVIAWAELEGLEEGWAINKGVVEKVEGPVIEVFDNEETANLANSVGDKTPSDFSRRLRTYELIRNQPKRNYSSGTISATPTAQEIMAMDPAMYPGVAGVMPALEAIVIEQAVISSIYRFSRLRNTWKISKLARIPTKRVNPGGDLIDGGEFINDFARTYKVPATLKAPKISKVAEFDRSSLIGRTVAAGKQNAHISGTNNYRINVEQNSVYKSTLELDAQTLIDEFAAGQYKILDVDPLRKSIKVDFGKPIGTVINQTTGANLGTTNIGAIKYGSKVHITPVN